MIKLSSNDQVNSFFDGLIKSRFIEIFGDPIHNDKDWNMFSLDTYCTITTGNTPSRTKKEYYGGDLEWIKSDNITSESIVTSATECLSKDGEEVARVVGPNSILMVCIAGSLQRIGDVALTDRRVSFNQQINAIYSDSYNPRFLLELFKITKPILQQEIGMALKGVLSKSKLSSLEYIFPPIDLQNQFADFVEQVDRTRSIFQQIVSQYGELVKSRFIEMFGQIDLSIQSPEWDKIKDVGIVLTGSTPKTGVDEYWDGDNLWITPAELTSDRKYYDDTQRKISDLGVHSCSLDQIEPGTVLLTSRAPIGKVGIATSQMYCNQGFKNIRCGSRINPEYLYTLMFYNTEYLNSLGRGATFKEISRKIVESIRIPVPPIELQNQFADFVKQVDKSKARLFDYLINSLQVSTN